MGYIQSYKSIKSIESIMSQSAIIKPKVWKRFIDDIFVLWEDTLETLHSFLADLNKPTRHSSSPGQSLTVQLPRNLQEIPVRQLWETGQLQTDEQITIQLCRPQVGPQRSGERRDNQGFESML